MIYNQRKNSKWKLNLRDRFVCACVYDFVFYSLFIIHTRMIQNACACVYGTDIKSEWATNRKPLNFFPKCSLLYPLFKMLTICMCKFEIKLKMNIRIDEKNTEREKRDEKKIQNGLIKKNFI